MKEKLKLVYRKHTFLFRAALMALLPLLCCIVTCAAQGRTIGQVYLPASEWNDELFYYKQVEAIVNHGYPMGYFGFNESHALKLSFAAWSPVLLSPWILWGLVFGWNLLSPIYCNIFLLTLAVFLYVLLAKPDWKQLGILTLLFCLFTPFTRYMLSGMPEIICFSILIVFYGLAVSWMESEKTWKLVWLFLLSGVLTLMRPYLLLFLFLPAILWIKRNKRWGIPGSVGIMGIVGILYLLIKHYFAAEYFLPLFDTKWVTTFFDQGIVEGVLNVLRTLYYAGTTFFRMTFEGFRSGLATGAYFGGYLTVIVILLCQTWVDFRKKNHKNMLLNGHLLLCFLGMWAALLLMYRPNEGSKHLLTFIAVGIFAISRMETRFYKKAMLMGAVSAYLYTFMASAPYDYQIPFVEEELKAEVDYWEEIFDSRIVLDNTKVPGYENVMIWVFNDTADGEGILGKWQILYSLPDGMGISCCYGDYIVDNFTELNSRYMMTPVGGRVEAMCQEAGMEEIGRVGDTVVYQR